MEWVFGDDRQVLLRAVPARNDKQAVITILNGSAERIGFNTMFSGTLMS